MPHKRRLQLLLSLLWLLLLLLGLALSFASLATAGAAAAASASATAAALSTCRGGRGSWMRAPLRRSASAGFGHRGNECGRPGRR